MLASLLCNFPFVPRPIKWRNRFGVFDTLEEARAAAQDAPVQEVYEIEETPGFVIYEPVAAVTAERPSRRRQTDDEALVFILANL